jgi:hypothetical protein
VSRYPRAALPFLRQFDKLRSQSRDPNFWFWKLCLDPADYPMDAKTWVSEWLGALERDLAEARKANFKVAPGEELSILRRTGFANAANRIRNPHSRSLAVSWLIAWGLDNERSGIFTSTPEFAPTPEGSDNEHAAIKELSYFDLLTKLLGAPSDRPVIPASLVDRGIPYWIARCRRSVAAAPSSEIERVKAYLRVITEILDTAQKVDWGQVPPLGPIGEPAKPEPGSWRRRKAMRSRALPPPDLLNFDVWSESAVFFGLSFGVLRILRVILRASKSRRYEMSLIDQLLGIVQQWVNALPRKATKS